ncbi:DEAD/DEAH box helicase [Nocardioides sp.]|nr:DEAD/DEAH box helicase [Nocardioides sp.]
MKDAETPRWRPAQVGALGALLSHWSVHDAEPALLSLPTGAGKSAIATAIPYLSAARRVLVVVPSKQLRSQLAEGFRTQSVLRDIGALDDLLTPRVVEMTGRASDWSALEDADVVVAIPTSISPEHYDKPPRRDLFDLIIVDEAHHASARTWRAILEHFASARRVLLTATPKRRDRKRLPGDIAFHYPLSRAIAEGYYKPVSADLIDVTPSITQEACDDLIMRRTLAVLDDPAHESSTVLVRANTAARARDLAQRYSAAGRDMVALTSSLSAARQEQIIAGLRDGSLRSVAVVGMLGEGFDLPRLRVAAYHDKHRSLSPTIQLIGRLVRSHPDFPQPSVLVAARDIDVFPSLQGGVRALYEEDADWASLVAGVIDNEIAEAKASRAFASALETAPNELSVESMVIPVRATVWECRANDWTPDFQKCLDELPVGARVRGGHEVFYRSMTMERSSLLLVTRRTESPRWHAHSGLESNRFDLHLLTWVPPRLRGQAGLLLANSDDGNVRKQLFQLLDTTDGRLRAADPERLHGAFDSLPRVSVSNVGVRNTNSGGRGTASYKTFAGPGVDRGLREVDTAQGAIGHAMAQVSQGEGLAAYNVGIAVEKAKMWESRLVPIRLYDDVMASFGARYWSSSAAANPLLPDVTRGSVLGALPESEVAFTDWHPGLLGADWYLDEEPLEHLDLQVRAGRDAAGEYLKLELRTDPAVPSPLWVGRQDLIGEVSSANEQSVEVHRGFATARSLEDLLTEFPPTVYFASGQTVVGSVIYERPRVNHSLSRLIASPMDWPNVDLEKQLDSSAVAAGKVSVHSYVRSHLVARPSRFQHRWVLHNDGKGEFADLIILELNIERDVRVELWHVKPAGGAKPSARVTDVEVVGAQAAKSRRWFSDPDLFTEMSARYVHGKSPVLTVVDGDDGLLTELLSPRSEQRPWTLLDARPVVRGEIVVAQPGLSWSKLEAKLATNDLSAVQIRDLLCVLDDAVGSLAVTRTVCAP